MRPVSRALCGLLLFAFLCASGPFASAIEFDKFQSLSDADRRKVVAECLQKTSEALANVAVDSTTRCYMARFVDGVVRPEEELKTLFLNDAKIKRSATKTFFDLTQTTKSGMPARRLVQLDDLTDGVAMGTSTSGQKKGDGPWLPVTRGFVTQLTDIPPYRDIQVRLCLTGRADEEELAFVTYLLKYLPEALIETETETLRVRLTMPEYIPSFRGRFGERRVWLDPLRGMCTVRVEFRHTYTKPNIQPARWNQYEYACDDFRQYGDFWLPWHMRGTIVRHDTVDQAHVFETRVRALSVGTVKDPDLRFELPQGIEIFDDVIKTRYTLGAKDKTDG